MPARGTATNRGLAVNRGLASGRLTASGRLNVSGGGGGGGGGADLTNVSSLPSPGSADATVIYHLSTDDQCYMLNAAGTAMVPVDLPGWPRRDAANDQEWEGSNADPPSGWAWQTQASWAVDVNNTRKSCIEFTQSTNSGNFTTIYRSATLTTSGKRVQAHFEIVSSAAISNTNGRAGVIYRNSTSGRAVCYYVEYGAAAVNMNVIDLTDATTGSVTFTGTGQLMLPMGHPIVLSITNDGVNLNMKYAPLFGADESDFIQVWSESLASFINGAGGACDQFGYLMNMNTGGQTLKIISDWIRIV